ncbi:Cys-Gln thioester bond-forming surface protein [Methanobrevibacter sp.]
MKMKLLLILAILIITVTPVMAGNNTTVVDNPTQYISDEPMTEALESGDSNISFADGYRGYCIEWGEHSAEKGDKFYVHDRDVDNNIKTFFVYFYEDSQRDVIATQHMIWKFTDNKQFSRFNQTLYEKIVEKAATVQVPNDGVLKVNDTTEMVYSFRNFISNINEYQNYFAYRIYFTNITPESNLTENSTGNSSAGTSQNATNETNIKENFMKNHTNASFKRERPFKVNGSHDTGNPLVLLLLSLAVLVYKRRT